MNCPKEIRLACRPSEPHGVCGEVTRPFLLLLFIAWPSIASAEDHWAFRKVQPPAVENVSWHGASTLIDGLHGKLIEANDLRMADRASRETLARRLHFNLTGLPASYDDVTAFVEDPSSNAYERLIDRLIASPRYGERWARHWLDVARYADNKGYVFEEERRYPYAYTYRDWVAQAFNHDLPYDQFLIHQIAGDQVAKATGNSQAYAAMGFLTLGRRFLNRQPDIIDDRIDVLTRGTMGLTVACSRCHDHKFDPIPIEDYYSLYGVFASSEEPSEKPLLGEPDHGSPAYQEFVLETEMREDEISEYFEVRHRKLRTEPILRAYFQLAYDGRDWGDPKISSRAQKEKLYQKIAIQWRDLIKKGATEGETIFVPWAALAGASPEDYSKQLQHVKDSSHPLLWKALMAANLKSMQDVVAVYAREIALANGDAPHKEAERESLRQLLVAGDSPTGLKPENLYRIFNTPEQQEVRRLRRRLEKHRAMSPGAPPRGMALVDRTKPVEPRVFVRGNSRAPGKTVPRQFLLALSGNDRKPFQQGSGRLELAKAIACADNPLTARVFVNRTWMQFFGRSLVESPSDFGVRTPEPLLHEVLDALAWQFMQDGWSMKKLHRTVLQSQLYQQDSVAGKNTRTKDVANVYATRMERRRLEFEAMRDAVLAVSDSLDLQTGGHPAELFKQPFSKRRALYGFIDRQNLPSTFRTFDMASPDAHSPQRLNTTVPQQALFMMNGPLVEQQAETLAKQARNHSSGEVIPFLYKRLFARLPDAEETMLGHGFIDSWTSDGDFEDGLQAYAHALLCSNEFMFVD